jgi:hypothetical protein
MIAVVVVSIIRASCSPARVHDAMMATKTNSTTLASLDFNGDVEALHCFIRGGFDFGFILLSGFCFPFASMVYGSIREGKGRSASLFMICVC